MQRQYHMFYIKLVQSCPRVTFLRQNRDSTRSDPTEPTRGFIRPVDNSELVVILCGIEPFARAVEHSYMYT